MNRFDDVDFAKLSKDVEYIKWAVDVINSRDNGYATKEDLKTVKDSVDGINANIGRVVIGVITALITSAISLILRK